MKHETMSIEQQERKSRLVLFDVDGTLLHDRPDEISGRLFWAATEHAIIHPTDETCQELEELRSTYGESVGDERQKYLGPLIKEFDRNLHDKSIKKIRQLATEIAKQDLDTHLYSKVSDEVEQWREEGVTLGMISGSPDFYIQALKKHLNFDIATGTRHFHNGNTYKARPPVSRATAKHDIAEKMLERLGQNLNHETRLVAAYGDTVNDLSMLEMADQAVAVNAKNGLAVIALSNMALEVGSEHKKWRIIHSDIKTPPTHATASV